MKNSNKINTQDKINIIQKNYNNEIVRKTMFYQNKYKFELNPRLGHELWNVEGDAFKHAFMSADLALKMGQLPSLIIGIDHENKTPNNPQGEWNMDSWNNQKGREIAKEIQKEHGAKFSYYTQKQQDDIIAEKVMQKMRNGELITKPTDKRQFYGIPENVTNLYKKFKEHPTGFATQIQPEHIFSPEEIGKMSQSEFNKNETKIMEQLQAGKIKEKNNDYNLKDFIDGNSNKFIFTREDLNKMSTAEFSKHEKEISKQLNTIGIPYNHEIPNNIKTYSSHKEYNHLKDGKWVTINGHHVFIEKP